MRNEKLKTLDAHSSHIKKDYNQFKLQYNKQSVEEILIQRAVKTTNQIHYDKGIFDKIGNADKVLKDFFLTTRGRIDLENK